MHLLNKINIHHLLFSILGILLINFYPYQSLDEVYSLGIHPLILIVFIAITTIGLGHGALDGKIVWELSIKKNSRFKIYLIYLLIVLVSISIWLAFPIIGLFILFLMSIYHFGDSDLKNYSLNKLQKITWGFLVTMIPIFFHAETVNLIFVNLAEYQMNKIVINCIQILFIVCLIGWLRISFKKMLWSETSVLFVMLISGYFLDPLFWFGYYFCFYHGMRALMNHQFQLKKDTIWMIIFTVPVLIVWLICNELIQVSFIELLFPSLFALTVAHMQLDNIIKLVHVR